MSQMQRRGLPRAFSASIKVLGASAMLLTLTGCTELARFIGKADPKPEEPVVAAETPPADDRVEGPVEKPKPSKLYEWNGDGRKVSRIVIDTDKQRASFFVGEDEIGWSTVASGLPKHPTPTGQFAVIEKVENKRSNLYGKVVKNGKVVRSNAKAGRDPIPAGASFEGAHMPYFMRLTGDGIGLHAGPIPRPGQPASHGCIRLPSTLAPVLFKHVSHGTQVTIVGSGPSYGNYVEKQRVAAAQQAARAAEQRRIAEAKAAEAPPAGAEATSATASTTPPTSSPQAGTPPTEQAAATATAAEPSPTPETGSPAADPANGSTAPAPAASTASASPREPSPVADAPAADASPTASVTSAPAAATASPANPPRSEPVAVPPAQPEQAQTESGPTPPPETKAAAAPEAAQPAAVVTPPAEPPSAQSPAAQPPPTEPAPAAAAESAPPPTAPAAEAPPAAPAASPAQAQQAPAAAAQGNDG
jgi:hypothetical protein